jgi:hypothetical protein
MGHQLPSHLFRKPRIKPTSNIDGRQFLVFAPVVCFEFRALKLEFGLFGVGL